jgi:hypothetical protein
MSQAELLARCVPFLSKPSRLSIFDFMVRVAPVNVFQGQRSLKLCFNNVKAGSGRFGVMTGLLPMTAQAGG